MKTQISKAQPKPFPTTENNAGKALSSYSRIVVYIIVFVLRKKSQLRLSCPAGGGAEFPAQQQEKDLIRSNSEHDERSSSGECIICWRNDGVLGPSVGFPIGISASRSSHTRRRNLGLHGMYPGRFASCVRETSRRAPVR